MLFDVPPPEYTFPFDVRSFVQMQSFVETSYVLGETSFVMDVCLFIHTCIYQTYIYIYIYILSRKGLLLMFSAFGMLRPDGPSLSARGFAAPWVLSISISIFVFVCVCLLLFCFHEYMQAYVHIKDEYGYSLTNKNKQIYIYR